MMRRRMKIAHLLECEFVEFIGGVEAVMRKGQEGGMKLNKVNKVMD
jgi:hypothetical protein